MMKLLYNLIRGGLILTGAFVLVASFTEIEDSVRNVVVSTTVGNVAVVGEFVGNGVETLTYVVSGDAYEDDLKVQPTPKPRDGSRLATQREFDSKRR